MFKNRAKGKFIVLEGPDGSGQSTQVRMLSDYLTGKGIVPILTKEPTLDSQAGQVIRRVLDREIVLASDEIQSLFIKDRQEHLDNLILPSLEKGLFVISDRYFLSTCAFGGIDLAVEELIEKNDNFLLPDVTFILDVSSEVCIKRIGKRGKAFEFFEKREKLEKVMTNYRLLAKMFDNTYLINGELPKEQVFETIKEKLAQILNI